MGNILRAFATSCACHRYSRQWQLRGPQTRPEAWIATCICTWKAPVVVATTACHYFTACTNVDSERSGWYHLRSNGKLKRCHWCLCGNYKWCVNTLRRCLFSAWDSEIYWYEYRSMRAFATKMHVKKNAYFGLRTTNQDSSRHTCFGKTKTRRHTFL